MSVYYTIIAVVTIPFILRWFRRLFVSKCQSQASMNGKVIIVTGANSGIGFETAKDLAARGARVILACRNKARGLTAQNQIRSETNNEDVVYKNLDLSSLASVRAFANDILINEKRLDVLVNNAGMFSIEDRFTEDGIIENMQVNYFGPFLLTLLLLPLMKKSSSRILNVSSVLHYLGTVDFNKINKKDAYGSVQMYANSKLCIVLFTVELAKHLKGSGVVANSLHPGVIKTNITNSNHGLFYEIGFKFVCWLFYRSALEGAQTMIYLSVAEECAGVSGEYFDDCSKTYKSWKANDKELTERLWDYSAKLVGFNDDLKL